MDAKTRIEKKTFQMGENILIGVKTYGVKSLKNYEINVRLHTHDNIDICAFRTRESYLESLPDLYGLVETSIEIHNPNLFNGSYSLSIALSEKKALIKLIDNAISFDIIPARVSVFNDTIVTKNNTLIYIPHKWQFKGKNT